MQVIFLRDHVNNKSGDSVDLNDGLANYLVRTGVAKPSTDDVEKVAGPENESSADDLDDNNSEEYADGKDAPGEDATGEDESGNEDPGDSVDLNDGADISNEEAPEEIAPEKVEIVIEKEKVVNPQKKGKHKR